MSRARKPFGVWMLLMSGDPWMFCREKTLTDALVTARTLRGDSPLFPRYRVWIADPKAVVKRGGADAGV